MEFLGIILVTIIAWIAMMKRAPSIDDPAIKEYLEWLDSNRKKR